MLYHYVLTVQSRRRWWRRRCVHTVSGHAQVQGQLVEKMVYDRIYDEVVKTSGFNPARTCCLFYRLVPELSVLDPDPNPLDVEEPAR